MNFDYMPELRWKFGYLEVWIGMTIIAGGMVLYFKRKKWF
jgi:magnesium transporter